MRSTYHLVDEELHAYSSPDKSGDQIENEMGGACSSLGETSGVYRG